MSKHIRLGLSIAAAAALAGCDTESHTIGGGADVADADAAPSAPVTLPPSITATKSYRCADNKIVLVDWLSDGKSANMRTDPDATPVQVTAAEEGKPMTAAGGYELSGTSGAPSARITVPGHAAQSCKA